MSKNTVRMIFFTDHWAWNFFFTGESVLPRQYDLLYWPLCPEHFLYWRVCVSTSAWPSLLTTESWTFSLLGSICFYIRMTFTDHWAWNFFFTEESVFPRQCDLLYRPLCLEYFLYWRVFVSTSAWPSLLTTVPGTFSLLGSLCFHIRMTFTDLCARNIFFTGESVFPRQHDLLYSPLCQELFLYQRVIMFPLHGLFFRLSLVVTNSCRVHL